MLQLNISRCLQIELLAPDCLRSTHLAWRSAPPDETTYLPLPMMAYFGNLIGWLPHATPLHLPSLENRTDTHKYDHEYGARYTPIRRGGWDQPHQYMDYYGLTITHVTSCIYRVQQSSHLRACENVRVSDYPECQITQTTGNSKTASQKKINNYCNCMMNTLLVLEDIHYCC